MHSPPLDPHCSDRAPDVEFLTHYDEVHLLTYLRLLNGYADGADWRDVAHRVLHIDPRREPERARAALQSHLARARWMTENGYGHLLRGFD
jgi:T6SS, Transcription factor, DNA binding domain